MIIPQMSDLPGGDATLPVATLNSLIGRNVVQALGSPDDMLKVKVHPLGGDHYRVNVLVGKSINSARIAESFFLTADGQGNIISCSPKIVRLY